MQDSAKYCFKQNIVQLSLICRVSCDIYYILFVWTTFVQFGKPRIDHTTDAMDLERNFLLCLYAVPASHTQLILLPKSVSTMMRKNIPVHLYPTALCRVQITCQMSTISYDICTLRNQFSTAGKFSPFILLVTHTQWKIHTRKECLIINIPLDILVCSTASVLCKHQWLAKIAL